MFLFDIMKKQKAMFRQWTEGPSEHASARTRGYYKFFHHLVVCHLG